MKGSLGKLSCMQCGTAVRRGESSYCWSCGGSSFEAGLRERPNSTEGDFVTSIIGLVCFAFMVIGVVIF